MEIPGYRIEDRVAEGGMATVYLAIQESLNRRVALKLLKKFDTPEQSERFVNEGRIIASLNHRNIITIHDIGRVEGRHYISMEYLEGGGLDQRIKDGMPPDAAITLTRMLGQCLAFIHDKGIIHRDIKPGNILFRRDGTPILTDFGIAKEMHRDTSLTMDGSALGSPDYLSPEQAESKSLDGRADLYSLGIVLFEMLTGDKPYRGDSYIETVMEHITAPIPDLPRPLKRYQELVDRMIAKKPGDRFASAGEMIAYIDTLDHSPREEGLSHKLAGLVGSLHRSGTRSSGPAPTMEIAQEELPLDSSHHGTHKAREVPPAGKPRAPLRYLVLAGAALILVATAAMLALSPSEEPAIEEAHRAPTEVERHLVSARQAMQSERLTSPPENNAYFHYRKVLEIDPGNEAAKVGIADIGGRYADSAEQQLTQGNLDAARLQIENGLSILPGEAGLLVLQQRVTALENAEIESYLLRAKVALDANKLTTPVEDNAYAYYQEVLARRPDHDEALKGIALIADRYADLAEASIDGYEYSDAKIYVQKGLKVQPDHARLLALQERTNAVKDVPDRILKGIKSAFD